MVKSLFYYGIYLRSPDLSINIALDQHNKIALYVEYDNGDNLGNLVPLNKEVNLNHKRERPNINQQKNEKTHSLVDLVEKTI